MNIQRFLTAHLRGGLILAAVLFAISSVAGAAELLNVSYDPRGSFTRNAWRMNPFR